MKSLRAARSALRPLVLAAAVFATAAQAAPFDGALTYYLMREEQPARGSATRAAQLEGVPEEMILQAKAGRSRLSLRAGENVRVFLGTAAALYEMDPVRKSFVNLPIDELLPSERATVKVRLVPEKRLILGLECIRYELEVSVPGTRGEVTYHVWTTGQLDVNVTPLYRLQFGFGTIGNLLRQVKGVPLEIESSRGILLRAVRLSRVPQEAAQFEAYAKPAPLK